MFKLSKYLNPYRPKIVLMLIMLFLQVLGTLYLPTLTAEIVNNGIVKGDLDFVWRTGGVMLGVALLTAVVSVLETYLSISSFSAMGRDLRNDLFRKSQELTINEFNSFGAASMITRCTHDVERVQEAYTEAIEMLLPAPVMAIAGLVLAFRKNPSLALLIVVMGRGELRSLTAMVLQESWLFGGTIKENIAYGHEGASCEAVYEAANAACADHFIRTLPRGYDTILSEELNSLSQGQRQIITIARAILADPMILILDEATSSVDTKTELEIQKAMDALMEGRTSFVIAHRLSTIRNADRILVMNNGSVIEQGTHEELMRKNGFYADLYNSQFALGT